MWLDDEEEELHPVYIGKGSIQKEFSTGISDADSKVVGYRHGSGLSGVQILERPVDEIEAILNALDNSSKIQLDTSRSIMPIHSVGEYNKDFTYDPDSTKTGAKIVVEHKDEREPDMMICSFCMEEFKNE
jgi:hypothetical protein